MSDEASKLKSTSQKPLTHLVHAGKTSSWERKERDESKSSKKRTRSVKTTEKPNATIEFSASHAQSERPLPMSVSKDMTSVQKRMTGMFLEMIVEDVEAHRQVTTEVDAAATVGRKPGSFVGYLWANEDQHRLCSKLKDQTPELQCGTNIVSSLKNLARTHVDIFGAEEEEKRKKEEVEVEERLRRREREKVVWDGHTVSKANTLDKFSTNVNFDEQIAAIYRSKGLGLNPHPAHVPPATTSFTPRPTPLNIRHRCRWELRRRNSLIRSSTRLPLPISSRTRHASQPFGYQPARVAALSGGVGVGVPPSIGVGVGMGPGPGAGPGPQLGMVRSADEMDGGEDGHPSAKRQKLAKLPGGQY
ncbi:hypothetical protein NLI96_g9081 [Meripilus lineatus]|uniref:Uncharacterized protein n=1 Tax=Meripilus lineatus TaxID=2056292 RepID=A0AAD5V1D1_9APHY|nr:hypothetical protein NLI96_g9081 [Physisporinus lineatus]